jgi:CheY-like chemotaxis protein
VLVVADTADSREMYTFGLSMLGFRPVGAANADEAFARAVDSPLDAIVVDLTPSSASGIDLVRRLRADSRTGEAGILFLSGHEFCDVQQAAAAAGCDRFLLKPCLPETLAVEIRTVLGSRPGREARLLVD